MINDAIRIDIENSVLCWLATVDDDGTPSVTPKEIFTGYGEDHLVIADIASSHSVSNAIARPKVCVSFVDVFRQRGSSSPATPRSWRPATLILMLSVPICVAWLAMIFRSEM